MTASVTVGDTRRVFRGIAPTAFFFVLFFLYRSKCNTNGFLIQTDLVLSLRFQVATSRRGKSALDQEIGIVSSFSFKLDVCYGIRSSQVGSAFNLLQYPLSHS